MDVNNVVSTSKRRRIRFRNYIILGLLDRTFCFRCVDLVPLVSHHVFLLLICIENDIRARKVIRNYNQIIKISPICIIQLYCTANFFSVIVDKNEGRINYIVTLMAIHIYLYFSFLLHIFDKEVILCFRKQVLTALHYRS